MLLVASVTYFAFNKLEKSKPITKVSIDYTAEFANTIEETITSCQNTDDISECFPTNLNFENEARVSASKRKPVKVIKKNTVPKTTSTPSNTGTNQNSTNSTTNSSTTTATTTNNTNIPNVIPPTTTPQTTPQNTDTETSTQTNNQTTNGNYKFGAYLSSGSTSALTSFESSIGRPVDIRAVFVGWGGDDFPNYLTSNIKGTGKSLLIYWEPSNGNSGQTSQPAYNYDSIINGNWDSYIRSFAQSAKAYGDEIILIPFNEMNGDWYPWAGTKNGNTPAKSVLAWRHMHNIFTSVGTPNVKWGFAPNSTSWPNTPENDLTKYYAGDAYVDIVGADGFNFGNPWETFDQIFAGAMAKLATYNKPIYIFSMASTDGPQKPAWIEYALTVGMNKYNISGFIWFNENKERNWLINSSPESLSAFKNSLPTN